MRNVVGLLLALSLVGSRAALAQDEGASIAPPAPVVPKELKIYADRALVLKNVEAVISVLASAQFERWISEYESGGKKVRTDLGLKDQCDTPQYQAFYRGMHLAHAGYYLFLAKQEVGWFEYASPIDVYDQPRRKFAGFGRGVLVQLWHPERISDVHRLASELTRLPLERRSDLVAFLSVLREYRVHVTKLVARAGEKMHDLLRRESSGYFYDYLSRMKVDKEGKVITSEHERGLTYSDLSKALRELINSTRDPETPQVSECLVFESPFRLKLGVDSQIVSEKIFVPVKYMVGFWLRRRAEGTESLADFALARATEALKTGTGPPN